MAEVKNIPERRSVNKLRDPNTILEERLSRFRKAFEAQWIEEKRKSK